MNYYFIINFISVLRLILKIFELLYGSIIKKWSQENGKRAQKTIAKNYWYYKRRNSVQYATFIRKLF